MFSRWMKEPYQDQGVMGGQADPGPVTVMGGQEDPGPITDQDRSIMFKVR